jgi:hypothetical protein
MKILGFNVLTNDYYYALLDGDKTHPILIEKNKCPRKSTPDIGDLQSWYYENFLLLIDRLKPEKVAYRLVYPPPKNKDYVIYVQYPLGLTLYL